MRLRASLVCLSALCALAAVPAQALVLTFDDVPGGSSQGGFGDLPSPVGSGSYLGFQFSATLDWIDVVGGTWNFGAHSGDFAILNNLGGPGVVTEANGEDFTFTGLWAKRWNTAPDSGGEPSLVGTLEG